MIPFFRKIRKKMADDNRPLKYMRYAVGEIVLVVIGILIALQINNWNEHRQESQRIRLQLTNLQRDLKADKIDLKNTRGFHAFRVRAAYYLLEQYGNSTEIIVFPEAGSIPKLDETGIWSGPVPESYDQAFVVRGFSWLVRKYPSIPNKDSFDEFKSTGLYALFDNEEIKYNLSSYYSFYSFIFPIEEQYMEINLSNRLKNSLTAEGYSYLDVSALDNPVDEILSFPIHRALLKNIIDESTYRSNEASGLIKHLDSLLLKIQNEIDNYTSG